MAQPASFQCMSSCILPSQDREVLIAKQSSLANLGRQTQSALSKLPPDLVDSLLIEYKVPEKDTLDKLSMAITEREGVNSSVKNGRNLDVEWLKKSEDTSRNINEKNLSSSDSWNEGPSV